MGIEKRLRRRDDLFPGEDQAGSPGTVAEGSPRSTAQVENRTLLSSETSIIFIIPS